MEDLNGRVGVVTGAASGIGRAVAEAMGRAGMRVALADVQVDALEAACAELSGAGLEVIGVPTDVASPEAIANLAAETVKAFGRVDVVHSNAGVVAAGLVEEISLEAWKWVLDVDLWSVIHAARTFLPILKAQGSGHIVNTASTAGLQANAGIGPYNVAKFGVVALSETLRLECEGTGVGVSVLCPGAVNTRIVDAERNRPGHVPPSTGETADGFKQRSSQLLSTTGLAPSAVADMVIDAVRTDRFWVLTHPAWYPIMERRAAAMSRGELERDFGG